jgi:hypothetical protein
VRGRRRGCCLSEVMLWAVYIRLGKTRMERGEMNSRAEMRGEKNDGGGRRLELVVWLHIGMYICVYVCRERISVQHCIALRGVYPHALSISRIREEMRGIGHWIGLFVDMFIIPINTQEFFCSCFVYVCFRWCVVCLLICSWSPYLK